MSMSKESINAHLEDPAVFCCQRRKGTVIGEADLEDPTIFADLEESGILTLLPTGLKIREVLGAVLKKDAEALTSITADFLERMPTAPENTVTATVPENCGYGAAPSIQAITGSAATSPSPSAVNLDSVPTPSGSGMVHLQSIPTPPVFGTIHSQSHPTSPGFGMVHLHIDELKGLDISFPWGSIPLPVDYTPPVVAETTNEAEVREKTLRTLIRRDYAVKEVRTGHQTSFAGGVLTIDESLILKAGESNALVKKVELDIITPEERHIYTNTIMDVIPVAAKVKGKIGEGETAVLDGVVFCLTGLDEKGVQVHEFGSCEGYLDEKIAFGRPGCPDETDIIIRVNVVIQENTGMERRGPLAAHSACDVIIQDIREALKVTDEPVLKEEVFRDVQRIGRPRVVLIKEIMGQGAMHDNILLPTEPAGVSGGQKNVDLGNVPVMLSPNEVRDGGIHALTCIGPATKEMTRHYFREPLVEVLVNDDELDLVGVIFVGSPQVNDEKAYVAGRLGAWVETMGLDGAIITTEGFGNNHIDFAGHIAAVGSRGIPVVGVTFSAYQGQLVVGNQYMDAMIEINKDADGFENEVLACSSICADDARRAVLMLKTKMAGVPIAQADRKWSQAVVDANQRLVDNH
ncbi:subunit of proline reductase [Clostridia bacterium]|nr:subunit of proline reductase [Clostridia bacterium]